MRLQRAPQSVLTYSARSVPANTTLGFPGYSWMLRTDASGFNPVVTAFHVLPKSVVRAMYGAKSPTRCWSNATYAVPRDAPEATIRATKLPSAIPAPLVMAALVSCHVAPPSVETWTLPSSVPTHSTFGSTGDSPIAVIWLKLDSPSLREILMSRSSTPMSLSVSRLMARVRSGVRVHVVPMSFEMNSRFAPRYTVPAVCRDATSGASQSHR